MTLQVELITITPPSVEVKSINPFVLTPLNLAPIQVPQLVKVVPGVKPNIYVAPVLAVSKLTLANFATPLRKLNQPPAEKEIHYWRGKPSTIPEGTFYAGTHPFNRINSYLSTAYSGYLSSVNFGLTIRSGTLRIVDSNPITVSNNVGGTVNFSSLSVGASNSLVPEPSSLASALLALVGGFGLRRDRWRRVTRP